MENTPKEFYRFVYQRYGSEDFSSSNVSLNTYVLKKETPAGYWIGYENYGKPIKWVSKTSKKRFAYPEKEKALINFIKRTERRKLILKSQIKQCDEALSMVKGFKNEIL